MDELKERPEEFTKVLLEWIDKTNFDPIKIPVELDTTKADKWIEDYLAKYSNGRNEVPQQSLFPSSSSYASQAPYASGMRPYSRNLPFQ